MFTVFVTKACSAWYTLVNTMKFTSTLSTFLRNTYFGFISKDQMGEPDVI